MSNVKKKNDGKRNESTMMKNGNSVIIGMALISKEWASTNIQIGVKNYSAPRTLKTCSYPALRINSTPLFSLIMAAISSC